MFAAWMVGESLHTLGRGLHTLRQASPGRLSPSQRRLWRYGALRALIFYFFLSHFDDTVLRMRNFETLVPHDSLTS
jgi:hypothetical protein